MPFRPVEEQLEIIRRGVEKIVPEEELTKKLEESRKSGLPLRVKYGIDPTGIDLHLGHTVPMRKMRQFQELGHKPIIIIGNYTALVGDPSGRDKSRASLTSQQVEANAKTYLEQLAKVIDLPRDSVKRNPKTERRRKGRLPRVQIYQSKPALPEVYFNGDWFAEMSFADILSLFSKVTIRQLLTRDDFSKRFADQDNPKATIWMHEMFYPVMQAWDSVCIQADVELGGTEQLYSFMLARHLQQFESQPTQIGVMSPILVGLDGKQRMGKSLGNYIGISEPPQEMFGKLMSIPDEQEQADGKRLNIIRHYFELLTDVPTEQVDKLLAPDKNPKDAKIALAKDIVAQYHGADAAKQAAEEFDRVHSRRELAKPARVEIPSCDLTDGCLWIVDLVTRAHPLELTKSEARRQIRGGAVRLGEQRDVIKDEKAQVPVHDGLVVSIGKRHVAEIRVVDP